MARTRGGGRLGLGLLVAAAVASAPLACSLLTSYSGLTAQADAGDAGSLDAKRPDTGLADTTGQPGQDTGPREAGPACDAGKTACAQGCVDLTTDPASCGRCGRDCMGGACTMGTCEALTLASGQSTPGAIIVVSDALYWGNANEIMRCALPAEAVIVDSGVADSDLADADADADLVDADADLADAGIDASEPDGGVLAATCGASVTSYRSTPSGALSAFATEGARLFWLDNVNLWSCALGATCPAETPLVVPITRYAPPVAAGRGLQLVAGASALYWPGPGGIEACSLGGCNFMSEFAQSGTSGIALADATAYWGAGPAVTDCVATSTSCPAAMALLAVPGATAAFYLATDGTTVYWTEQAADGGVRSCPVSGCTTPAVVAASQATPTLIAADRSGVYWINTGTPPAIMACPPGGACPSPTVLWTGAYTPAGLAVDARAVYFTLPGASTVMAVAKL